MTISTIEQIREAPVGTMFTVTGNRWVKQADGLAREGYVMGSVPVEEFAGVVQASQIVQETGTVAAPTATPTPAPVELDEQWYVSNGTHRRHVGTHDGVRWFTGCENRDRPFLDIVAEPQLNLSRCSTSHSEQMFATAIEQGVAAFNERFLPAPVPGGLDQVQAALNAVLSEVNDEGMVSAEMLRAQMTMLGMTPVSAIEQVDVTVSVNGWTQVTGEQVSGFVGGDATARPVEVNWTATLYSHNEVERGTCPCGMVTRDWVANELVRMGYSFSRFDYEVSCPND